MIDELEKARNQYLQTKPRNINKWENIYEKLDEVPRLHPKRLYLRSLAAISVCIILAGLVVGAAQAAKPDQLLYPIKILSDNVVAKITGNEGFKIERRAEEVINSSNSQDAINEAAKEYQKSLEEIKGQDTQSGKNQLKESLQSQEERLRQELEKNPPGKEKLEDAIRQNQEAQGQIKGEKNKKLHNENQRNGRGNSN